MHVRSWPGDWIAWHARRTPEETALVWRERTIDWQTFDRRVRRLALGLKRRGLGDGDVVAAQLPNRPEWLYLFAAASWLGVPFAPLQMRLGARSCRQLLSTLDPSVLVTALSTAERPESEPTGTWLELDEAYDPEVGELAAETPLCEEDVPERSPSDPTLLLHTSGTTGAPKLVPHTARTLLWNHRQFIDELELTARDVCYSVAPLAHAAGANVLTGPILYLGGTVVLAEAFEPEQLRDTCEAHAVSCTFMVPAMWRTWLRTLEAPLEPETLRVGVAGGAPVSGELVSRARDHGVPLVQGYGMTEAGPMVSMLDADDPARHDRSVGWPGMHVEVEVVDPDDAARRAQGERGEIRVRGPNVVDGYWRDEEATRAAFDDDGWLYTGDLGVERGCGEFDVVGRLDDMFVSGGKNIHPREIERVVASMSSVREVGIVGMPHPTWGEAVTAAVVPVDPEDTPTQASIAEAVRAELADHKVPRRLALVESLPENPTGKLDRDRLRAKLEAHLSPDDPPT